MEGVLNANPLETSADNEDEKEHRERYKTEKKVTFVSNVVIIAAERYNEEGIALVRPRRIAKGTLGRRARFEEKVCT